MIIQTLRHFKSAETDSLSSPDSLSFFSYKIYSPPNLLAANQILWITRACDSKNCTK